MPPAAPSLPTRFPCWCRAVYSWGGETKRDLGFIEGDLIECLNAGDGSWWMGRLKRDRRMVGLFPSNFVEVLDESFQLGSSNGSPYGSIRATSPNPAPKKTIPQKTKSTFRKPFTAYYAAGSPNPAAAKREIQGKAGGTSPNLSTSGTITKHKPYSSMKRSSNEGSIPSPVPQKNGVSQFRAISPLPPSRLNNSSRAKAPSPNPQPAYQAYSRTPSPNPQPAYQPHSRAVSPNPMHAYQAHSRGASPNPMQTYQAHSRGPSPNPMQAYQAHSRGPSPNPMQNYQSHSRSPSPNPYFTHQAHSRGPSPAPGAQYQSHSRGPSPSPGGQYHAYSGATSPAPSAQYQAYSRGPSPSPYGNTAASPPPPAPPPHRIAYDPNRAPSPAPYNDSGYENNHQTPGPPSPHPHSPRTGNYTPSPLTNAMNDVMTSLEDMAMARKSPCPEEQPAAATDVWSPEAFDQVYQASAKKIRAQTSLGIGGQASYDDEDDDEGYGGNSTNGPPQVSDYVQRMEKRLRQMQGQQNHAANELFIPPDTSGPPPAVPAKSQEQLNRAHSSLGHQPSVGGRKNSDRRRLLKNRKSAYDIGREVLGRTFTTKSSSTNASSAAQSTTTQSSNSTQMTSQSLMSGYSASGISATSAGSLARRKWGLGGSNRPLSSFDVREMNRNVIGFNDQRPETPFTGVTYHSSHDSRSGNDWSGNVVDSGGPLGGLAAPKPKKSGFLKKIIDSAKTGAASARSTISSGSVSRPISRQRSMLATGGNVSIGGPGNPGSNAARDMGLNSSVDWVQVRRDVNRSNSLSKNERIERAERCEMMDIPVINPIDAFYETVEGDEGLDGLPITDHTDFTNCNLGLVDKSARFVNSLPPTANAASVAQGYVCRPYRSDVQRLRAIFTWVSERIAWDEDFEGQIDTRRVIQSKRGCSQEVAILVMEMCSSVGLHAEVVRGYLKTPGEILDFDMAARPNHYWNAVIVDGEWRIMDCSLASPTNPKRNQYSSAGSQVADGWWFLARPIEICYTHVPLLPEQQHICPPVSHDVLMALPCACPPYFKHGLQIHDYDTSLLNLDNLELAHIYLFVPEDVECVAEVEAKAFARDADGDYFESGDMVRKRALAQAEWIGGRKRYTIKALLPGDEGQGILKVYAGKRGLMHSIKSNPHSLAFALPITHTGQNPPYEFLTIHPTPHAQRHDLYIAQPQCSRLVINNTFVFAVRQHPSSVFMNSPNIGADPATGNGRVSPNPFIRPTSALSMVSAVSVSVTGSSYSNQSSNASSNTSDPMRQKPAKLAVQSPSGKIIRLTRRSGVGGSCTNSEGDGTTWETIIKIGERGVWRGLVLADRSARWCVFAEWECI